MIKSNQATFIYLFALLFLLLSGSPALCAAQSEAQQPASPEAQQPAASPQPQENEAQRNQQKARTWLDQMIQALGGQAYLTLQDSFTHGRYGRFHNEREVGEAIFYRYWKWPDLERNELTEQRDVVELYLGDK